MQPPALCLALLLLAVGWSSAGGAAAVPSAAPGQPHSAARSRALMQSMGARFQKPFNVCTSDWAPIVTCADIDNPDDYSGFQVQLWRNIAADLGWADSDWSFSCVDWTAMIEDLVSPNGNCSFAAAGVEVSLENIVAGLKFSWPIYKSGFRVLIATHVEDEGTWAFAQAFDWSVWVVLGATAVIVSILVTAAEALTYGNKANRKGLRGWSWYTMGKVVQVPTHVGDPKTWASRLLVLGYAFLVLIMVHLFTATTASKLTMQRLANDITGKQDLPGKKVMSWEPYVPLLRKYSIDATAMPWDNDADTEVMLANLRSNKFQALVLDSPVVQHFAAQAKHCDLFPVGDAFETFNLAIAFPPDAPEALMSTVSSSIVRLQTTQAILDKLENTFIKAGDGSSGRATCSSLAFQEASAGGHSSNAQITIGQVAGLWYILLITLGLAVVITLAKNVARHPAVLRFFRSKVHPAAAAPRGGKVAAPAAAAGQAAAGSSGQGDSTPEDHCVAEVAAVAASPADGKAWQQQAPGCSPPGPPAASTAATAAARQPAALQPPLSVTIEQGTLQPAASSPQVGEDDVLTL